MLYDRVFIISAYKLSGAVLKVSTNEKSNKENIHITFVHTVHIHI